MCVNRCTYIYFLHVLSLSSLSLTFSLSLSIYLSIYLYIYIYIEREREKERETERVMFIKGVNITVNETSECGNWRENSDKRKMILICDTAINAT